MILGSERKFADLHERPSYPSLPQPRSLQPGCHVHGLLLQHRLHHRGLRLRRQPLLR